jgi:HlyD family secretion protein
MRAPGIMNAFRTFPSSGGSPVPDSVRGQGPGGHFLSIPLLAPLLLSLSLVMGCGGGDSDAIRASGTVEATEAALGFPMAGRIAWIGVREGASVEPGQEVARLDQDELHARSRAADAALSAAHALLAELEHGFRPEEIAEGHAALRAAEEREADAQRDLQRAMRLFEGGAISREMLDKAETAARVAEAGGDQARERVRFLEEGPRRERIVAQRAAVAQAEAARGQVKAALANAVVTVPFPGVVTLRHREAGETVSPGFPVLTVMDPEDRWVRIYVRADGIGAVALGQQATITADTYPDRRYGGEVVFISNRAEFTPRNVQTAEERVRLVYAVKVRITEDPEHDLKPGIPADVVLEPRGGGARGR